MNIINEDVVDYLNKLYFPVDEDLGKLRLQAEEERIPIIMRDTESLIIWLMKFKQPKKILEVGTAIGYSAAVMAKTSKNSKIVTIERNQNSSQQAVKNLRDMGLANRVDVNCGDAIEFLDVLSKRESNNNENGYDFVFIDAGKSHYREFWDYVIKIVKSGGIILCDNVLMRATVADEKYDTYGKHKTSIRNMRNFINYITTLESVDTTILPVGDGVSISLVR